MNQKIQQLAESNNLNELAKYLLFETHLSINGNNYRMLEIELYIYNNKHLDIFTHKSNEQKNMLTWYFHQMSDKEHSYKGGTFKGLDISCGTNGGHGGILIRAIINEADNSVIEGPCNVVNKILELNKVESIKDFVINKFNSNLSCVAHNFLKLEEKHFAFENLYVAPRIGLTLKGENKTEKEEYINKNYRYIVFKDKIKKERKKMVSSNF
jgi:3-methyladenine DNA glycosylase Mpg